MIRPYSTQPMGEFLQNLRDGWVKHGLASEYLHKLDELSELGDLQTQEEAIEAARAEGEKEAEDSYQCEIDDLHAGNDKLAARVAELEDETDELQGKLDHALEQLAASRVHNPVAGQAADVDPR